MSIIINFSPSSLLTLGSTSLSSSDNNESLGTTGSLLTLTATSIVATGQDNIVINGRAEELRTTKAYIQSLSEEEKNNMMELLNTQEEMIKAKEVKTLSLKKNR